MLVSINLSAHHARNQAGKQHQHDVGLKSVVLQECGQAGSIVVFVYRALDGPIGGRPEVLIVFRNGNR